MSTETVNDKKQVNASLSEGNFPIVGLGASAGGLKAFELFFQNMSHESDMAFVLVQHLSPKHKSELAHLLQNYTQMKVSQITDQVTVQPNRVYVIPPGKHLVIKAGKLYLSKPRRKRGYRIPIDDFFRSLAADQGENAICVVLSGTGTDGTLGLKAIKEQGGITMVQSPQDAEYDGMPRSAIRTRLVDVIGTAAELAQRLLEYRHSTFKIKLPVADGALSEDGSQALSKILLRLRKQTGHDFTYYKRTTILRRLERRLQMNQIEEMSEYLTYLHRNPDEAKALFKDFLISVTNFFRNPEAFKALGEQVIPKLFATNWDQIRVWVPGCATGEEVYSIAILVHEYADQLEDPPQIQLFATDLDEEAIAFAREGLYPDSIAGDVSSARLKRFFTEEDGGYRIRTEVRETILFAVHNLIQDPPFSKLDLISCRNLLIYLNRDVQKRVLELFHYATRPNGYLFLGSSESIETNRRIFFIQDKKYNIFKRSDAAETTLPHFPPVPSSNLDEVNAPSPATKQSDQKSNLVQMYQAWTLKRYAPSRMLINKNYEITHVFGEAGRYLQQRDGPVTQNVLERILPPLQLDLQAALYQSFREHKRVSTRSLRIELNEVSQTVRMSIGPIEEPGFPEEFFEIVFEMQRGAAPGALQMDVEQVGRDQLIAQLRDELARTHEQLHNMTEEHQTSTEELKASNEELQSINEELQTTTEELAISKEELQSMNQELVIVNHELNNKIDEINQANSDLRNLIAATEIGTIFLDRDLRIKRYTPRVETLFNIIVADIGRPFFHISHNLDYNGLPDDAARVLSELTTIEREVHCKGRWYLARLFPYRTAEDEIDGVVMTFTEVTALKQTEQKLERHGQQQVAIAEVGQLALEGASLENLIEAAARRLCQTLNTDFCDVLELQPSEQTLLLRGGLGWPEEKLGQAVFALDDDSQGNYALQAGSPVIYEDLAHETRFTPLPLLTEQHVRSGMSVVIPGLQQSYGLLGVHSRQKHTFTKSEENFLQAMANVLAAAIERQQAETNLRQLTRTLEQRVAQRTARLQRRNQELDQFAYIASHDLKAPLRAINNLVAWIDDDAGHVLPEASQEHLAKLRSRVERMERLLDDLLTYSRAGQPQGEAEAVDTGALVHSVIELIGPPAAFSITVEPDMPTLNTARVPLAMALRNLIDNAIKHHHRPDGKVRISTHEEEAMVRFEVTDDGPGIDESFHGRVFEMFQTLQPRDEIEGSGVGLAIVKKIVESRRGEIEIRSKKSQGTTICFTWPKD